MIKVSYWRSEVRKKIDFFFSKASRKRQGPAPERKKVQEHEDTKTVWTKKMTKWQTRKVIAWWEEQLNNDDTDDE